MGLFRKKKEFKVIEDFDREAPIRDLFEMYIQSIDNTWEFNHWGHNITAKKVIGSADINSVELNFSFSINKGALDFNDSKTTIRLIDHRNYTIDTIEVKHEISDKLKEKLYDVYVMSRTKDNDMIKQSVENKISKFKNPIAKQFTRDNKINNLFN